MTKRRDAVPTVALSLDHDKPTEVALLGVRARDQQAGIGGLLPDPGGPGDSGVDTALAAPFLPARWHDGDGPERLPSVSPRLSVSEVRR
ncbi:hypothetical protein ABZ436_19030 [Micromonospora matsumotoense]|uniref:hypothetical protein n=1 Tax=Micromonospora matsumotoense TaxID=121616 RepID=UPI0033F28D20